MKKLIFSTLVLESYSHSSDEVQLKWMEKAVTLTKNIQLPDFDLVSFNAYHEKMLYPNGPWDQLRVHFFSFYITYQTFTCKRCFKKLKIL